jgi:hypothetical protein
MLYKNTALLPENFEEFSGFHTAATFKCPVSFSIFFSRVSSQ